MNWCIFLDSNVLGYLTHPKANSVATDCTKWLRAMLEDGARVCLAEISDYEIRRGYIRRAANPEAANALRKLDELKAVVEFVPIDRQMMVLAAELWADARVTGRPTAHDERLDIDVILTAQARVATAGCHLTIATTNIRH
ncbi:MAG: PIN domain-containing protein [Betaproteobacteria bacterium]